MIRIRAVTNEMGRAVEKDIAEDSPAHCALGTKPVVAAEVAEVLSVASGGTEMPWSRRESALREGHLQGRWSRQLDISQVMCLKLWQV